MKRISFMRFWQNVYAFVIWVCIAIMAISVTVTGVMVCKKIEKIVNDSYDEVISIDDATPLWLKIKHAGFRDYRIDEKTRTIIVRY